MKKLLLLFLTLISIFSFSMFTACGGGEIENNPEVEVVITLADTDIYLELGEEGKVNYTVTGATNTKTKWSSSNEAVCSVNNGNIVGLKEGTATISLTIEDETVTANVTVFTYQSETADAYTTPLEVYDYYYNGEVSANDFVFNFADYGMVYNKNVKAKFVKGNIELEAASRVSSDKSKLFVALDVLGAKNYGEGYSLIVSSADKKVEIPLETIVTKFINDKDDLHYLFYFGDMDFSNEYFVYDGYFLQTTDIDMEGVPLLNRLAGEFYLCDEISIDKNNPDISGRFATSWPADYTTWDNYFNVDAGFMGIYDGQGYSITNISMYDDQGGYPKSRQPLGGLFGNIGVDGVVKNLGVTATNTWVWYDYGSAYLLAYNVNGTLENVYAKVSPTLNIDEETRPTPSTNFWVVRAISAATLTNVVFELDIPANLLREYNPDDKGTNSKGKANYTTAAVAPFAELGYDAATAKAWHDLYADEYRKGVGSGLVTRDFNTYENCYFFYSSGTKGLQGTIKSLNNSNVFECYDYNNIPNKTFDIIEDSDYFELNKNGAPVFIGLGD